MIKDDLPVRCTRFHFEVQEGMAVVGLIAVNSPLDGEGIEVEDT